MGWSSVSVATLLILFRPDAAALYLPLVLVALVCSIICLAARRLAHGLSMLACVLLMPAVIVESVVSAELAKPITPPFSGARGDRPATAAAARARNGENEPVVEVGFLDQGRDEPGVASAAGCGDAEKGRQREASETPAECRSGRH